MEHINPDQLIRNPAFSQVITTTGSGKTIYIGGQNAVNAQAEIIGENDIAKQAQQVMKNLDIALKAAGASFENLVKLGIYIVQGQNAFSAFQASQAYMGQSFKPPTITVIYVAGLINPAFLLEIDAVAFIPD